MAIPLCIYRDNEMVGFVLYGPENSENGMFMSIDRFMIDQRFQEKVYGEKAPEKLIDTITGEYSGSECISKLKLK